MVSGNLKESRERLTELGRYLRPMAELMTKRKVGAVYLWGFPQVDAAAEKEYRFSGFEDWLAAVRKGDCDHRVWLFEEDSKSVQFSQEGASVFGP